MILTSAWPVTSCPWSSVITYDTDLRSTRDLVSLILGFNIWYWPPLDPWPPVPVVPLLIRSLLHKGVLQHLTLRVCPCRFLLPKMFPLNASHTWKKKIKYPLQTLMDYREDMSCQVVTVHAIIRDFYPECSTEIRDRKLTWAEGGFSQYEIQLNA